MLMKSGSYKMKTKIKEIILAFSFTESNNANILDIEIVSKMINTASINAALILSKTRG